jgi:hypothetical protein
LRGNQRAGAFQTQIRDQESRSAAEQRQQQALREEMSGETPPGGAQREPHGKLPLTRGRTGQKQVRQVGARNQQHERDGAEQHERGGADILQQGGRPRLRRQPPALVLLELRALVLIHAACDRGKLGVLFGKRRPRRQTRQDRELTDIPWHRLRITAPGNPEVGADHDEACRHDADDRR